MKNQKSQAWGIDLMIATSIFIVAVTVFFIYAINQTGEAQEKIEDLFYESKIISNSFLSEGYPEDWNSTSVIKIGLTTNNKLNNTKLNKLYEMITAGDYIRTKNILGIKYDYYFFLDGNFTLDSGEIAGIGKPSANKTYIQENSKNLIRTTRFTVYKDKPSNIYLYVWEE